MWGAIASAAASALGSYMSNKSKSDAYNDSTAFSREQFEYQKALHQNQIQWRVEDAKKAGVHPMAALGLSSMSFSPVSAASSPEYDNWLGEVGQNIDRAIQQGKTRAEREQAQALQDKLIGIQIRKGEADADLAETQAASARFELQRQLFPSPPPVNRSTGLVPGQGDSLSGNTSSKAVHRLFDLALHGNSAMIIKNPDIADAITESAWDNASANILREIENGNPQVIDEFISQLPKGFRDAINRGEMRITSVPGSGVFRIVPVGPDEEFSRYDIYGFGGIF